MKHIIFWSALFLFLGTHCSGPGPAKSQSAEFYVRYQAPEGQLRAEGTLREGPAGAGAQHAVAVSGGMRYQDTRMNPLEVQGTTYLLEQAGGYTPRHVFSWTDEKGHAQTFSMEMPAITAFSFDVKPVLLRTKPAVFTWQGAPLGSGEGLVFVWEKAADRRTVTMEVTGTPGQKQIEFPAVKLAELPAGEWTLYVVRKKIIRSQQADVRMSGVVEFYSQVDTIRVE